MGKWDGEVCKGEGDAFSAGGHNIDTVTAVVGEGGAKIVCVVPVGVPRKTVVGAVKRKTKLAWGVKGMGGEDGEGPTRQRGKDRGAKGA